MPADLSGTFAALKGLFDPYVAHLTVTADDARTYMLNAAYSPALKGPMYFGGVRMGKHYVSLYLMPVYTNPELLSPISDQLRKRLHGKSCFNFSRPESDLFADLALLIHAGYKRFVADGYIKP